MESDKKRTIRKRGEEKTENVNVGSIISSQGPAYEAFLDLFLTIHSHSYSRYMPQYKLNQFQVIKKDKLK